VTDTGSGLEPRFSDDGQWWWDGTQWIRAILLSALLLISACSWNPLQRSGPAGTSTPSAGATGALGPRVVTTTYPTDDLVIANVVATLAPYDADKSGLQDATKAIQSALTACHQAGGGVVWLPAGKYLVTSSIFIPQHVTLRGDWRDPDQGSGSYGTVVVARPPPGGETDAGLFRISGSAGMNGLTIYYPDQSPSSPISYPYAVEILGNLLSGYDYERATVQRLTLLDAYRGIATGLKAGNALHTIRNVRGTVLLHGMYLQDSSDIGHNEDITFNGGYWANLDASLASSRPMQAQIDAWTRTNGTGLLMGGLDWDQFVNVSLSDFSVGIDLVPGRRTGMTASLFGINVRNAHIAMRVTGPDIYPTFGLNIANSTLQANQGPGSVGLEVVADNPTASVLLNNVTLGGGAETAARITGDLYVAFVNCVFDSWNGPYALTANRGTIALEGATFVQPLSPAQRGVQLLAGLSSATILKSAFSGNPAYLLDNGSAGTVVRQDSGFLFVKDRITGYSFPARPRPVSTHFINVTAAPYGARADGTSDDTEAIQRALNQAGSAGGGTVYLPAGIYVVRGHLRVPAGVELRGSDDGPHQTAILDGASGTILFAYEGRGTATPETAAPLILLDGDRAGVRGLNVHYPEQAIDSPAHMVAYPWTIRGNGTGVYAFDISFSNAYQALDFATNPTSDHYIGTITGFVLRTGVRVGNSTEGWVEDAHFNSWFWGGALGLPGQMNPDDTLAIGAAYSRAHAQAFVVTNGARHEHLVDDGVFGVKTGLTVEGDAQVDAINIGVDGSPNSYAVASTGAYGATLLNVQGCGCSLGGVGLAIQSGNVDIFNLLTLVDYQQAIAISGGSYQIEGAAIHRSFVAVTGGTGVLAGVSFQESGTQVTVSGAGSVANLWGNAGQGGFNATFLNGAQPLLSGNIPR
jgi:hypothetical protein